MDRTMTARQMRRRIAGLKGAVTRWERRDSLTDLLWSGRNRIAQITAARDEIARLERTLPATEAREADLTRLLWGDVPAA